jgi:hypothetical protein
MEATVGGAALGVGAAMLIPVVVDAAVPALRFVAKGAIKGGFFVYGVASCLVTDAVEGVTNLVEEARQEYENPGSHSINEDIKDVEHRVEKVVEKELEHECATVVETLILAAL